MGLPQEEQKLKISSRETVARLLEKAGQTGLPLIIRVLSVPNVAVKGRAKLTNGGIALNGFKVANISDRGIDFLAKNGSGGIQIEFVLSSSKLMFHTSISHFSQSDCTFTTPSYLISIERRKNARFPIMGNLRAYMAMASSKPISLDLGAVPYFESSKDLAAILPLSDISLGGVALAYRFPSILTEFLSGKLSESAFLLLPMSRPIAMETSIRWSRKTTDIVTDVDGQTRMVGVYRFGLQFVNPSEELLKSLRGFIQMIAHADAI